MSGIDSRVSSAVAEEPSSSEASTDDLAFDNEAVVMQQRRRTQTELDIPVSMQLFIGQESSLAVLHARSPTWSTVLDRSR